FLSAKLCVEAERSRPPCGKQEPDKAEQQWQLAVILPPPWAATSTPVHPEIYDGHFARGDERDGSREQPQDQQGAADRLDGARCPEARHEIGMAAGGAESAEPPQQLLGAMREVVQARGDAQRRVGERAPLTIELFGHE